ncbi:hypothetical protein B0T21DRAFT_433823 [Apiosordaria backusii]|uniref:Uncharacterized protein n=1 Tax=Apiosordaria backusii TaxID=314023 RepID=A0AA40EML5_9PEZI|nr:hypothetical protein B0T21DRAFT_433823 [Apiosordaria backusii]
MPRARYGAPVVFLDLALPEPIEYFVLPTVLVVVLLTVYLLGPQASYVFLPIPPPISSLAFGLQAKQHRTTSRDEQVGVRNSKVVSFGGFGGLALGGDTCRGSGFASLATALAALRQCFSSSLVAFELSPSVVPKLNPLHTSTLGLNLLCTRHSSSTTPGQCRPKDRGGHRGASQRISPPEPLTKPSIQSSLAAAPQPQQCPPVRSSTKSTSLLGSVGTCPTAGLQYPPRLRDSHERTEYSSTGITGTIATTSSN